MRSSYLLILFFFLVSCKGHRYRMPTGAMEETIMTGEVFYATPSEKFERNDIVVFSVFSKDYGSSPNEDGEYKMHWEKRAYRLIAYSGDSVEIKDGEVFINTRHIALPPKAKLQYEVYAKGRIEEFDELDPYVKTTTKAGDTMGYTVELITEKAEDYRGRKPFVISVKRKLPDMPINDTLYARASTDGSWSSNNFGPLRIPLPGETIVVDSINFKFYHNIPGIKIGENLLVEKLYFLLGDNRYGAEDSRFIGLISQSKMYGVVK
jgi:signal peptidase I